MTGWVRVNAEVVRREDRTNLIQNRNYETELYTQYKRIVK